ncbi:MAG: hypothetical protein BJ554DRAFT_5965 [Olpidium bornovanus]|uniref:Uncharacterized protein n=1 Tax=Olpidium bornovanus TaxID=278681 RepID=A0A8H7ZYN1_9FUNG|nr:MAG: hypothetical protein BJ554DRAFT_5965 [Olpidium bornovanus]
MDQSNDCAAIYLGNEGCTEGRLLFLERAGFYGEEFPFGLATFTLCCSEDLLRQIFSAAGASHH